MIRVLFILLLVDMQLLPPWELRRCPTEQYACYNFENAKKLMQLDAELRLRLLDCEVCEQTLKEQTAIGRAQEEIISKLQENLSTVTELFNARKELSEKLMLRVQRLERYNVFGKALPWVLSIFVISFASGFVLGCFLYR